MAGETKFINSLFVKNLLERKFKQTAVVVRKHTLESTSGYVHRLRIKYSSAQNGEAELQLLVLVKSALPSAEAAKEWQLLTDLLPRFADVARKSQPAVQFGFKLIETISSPAEVLIVEDTETSEFSRAANFKNGLNLAHSLVAIEHLATLHAVSAVIFSELPAAKRQAFAPGNLLQDTPAGANYFREALRCFIQHAPQMRMPGSLVQKLQQLQPRLLAKSAEDCAASLNGFSVLCHGNAWADNILFKQRNNEPVEARLIDWKTAFLASPVVDLMYFLQTSVEHRVAHSYRDQLIYTYHTRLSALLADLQFSQRVPTLTEMHVDFLKRGIFELMLTLTVAPYLRSPIECEVKPRLVQPFVNRQDVDLPAISRQVLNYHAENIIEELVKVDNNGLLDWGAESSNLKKLVRGFQ